jgi:hypothetical protein
VVALAAVAKPSGDVLYIERAPTTWLWWRLWTVCGNSAHVPCLAYGRSRLPARCGLAWLHGIEWCFVWVEFEWWVGMIQCVLRSQAKRSNVVFTIIGSSSVLFVSKIIKGPLG